MLSFLLSLAFDLTNYVVFGEKKFVDMLYTVLLV